MTLMQLQKRTTSLNKYKTIAWRKIPIFKGDCL